MSWTARMIAADEDFDGAPLLHKEIVLDEGHGGVRRATLHLTAYGVVEATLGGVRVGEEVLAPGWSSYEWRLRYRSHDVTDLLSTDAELVLALGNGWYRGRIGFLGQRAVYGDELGAWVQLEVEHSDGHVQTVVTDETWRAGPSYVTANDLLDGQTVDLTRDLTERVGVHALPFDVDHLVPAGPPIVRHEARRPERIWRSPSGRTLVDFGVNLVGWVRFRVRGERGAEIVVRHAEVLEDGELCTRVLRTAQATDRAVLSGGADTVEPTFTTHGFRYAEVTGWPGELTADDLEAVVVHTQMERIGTFRCSDPALDRLHDNVVRTLRGNAVGIPTDCPQRDERLGWTGDLAVFVPAAAYVYDVSGFLGDWLAELRTEQEHAEGRVPLMAPDPLKHADIGGLPPIPAAAIWGDASVWVPWTLWQAYGDERVLRDSWSSMTAYVDRVQGLLSERGLWEEGFQFGDWLDPQAPYDKPFAARADKGVVATACYHRSLVTVARIARVLGHDAWDLDERAARVRAAFNRHYVDDGVVQSDCATAYSLAIVFGLLDAADVRRAGERLAELVRAEGHRACTGFAGTSCVLEAMTVTGHLDDAYAMLLQTDCPSWLYQVEMGATTVWERWDSMLPDGSVNPDAMVSFSHYPLAAVADWMHRTVGGLAPLSPGYERILVAPRPGGGLTWAETSLETPHGRIEVSWRSGDAFELDVTVPGGTTAEVRHPDGRTLELGPGTHTL